MTPERDTTIVSVIAMEVVLLNILAQVALSGKRTAEEVAAWQKAFKERCAKTIPVLPTDSEDLIEFKTAVREKVNAMLAAIEVEA